MSGNNVKDFLSELRFLLVKRCTGFELFEL